jgi:hypothetical protein
MKTIKENKWYNQLLVVILLPIWLPLVLFILVLVLIVSIIINLSVWLFWSTRGIRLLYVYSNSPIWQAHIEQEILPKLLEGAIVLNWSERKAWKRINMASLVFWHFGGYRAFNPMAVILKPFRRAKVFRFYEAFKDYKYGKNETLIKLESDFFETLKR